MMRIASVLTSLSAGTAVEPQSRRFKASFAQRRLWFLARLFPDTALYNMPIIRELRGHLDPAALEDCINVIVARHGVLRTTFDEDSDGQVMQEVQSTRHVPLRVADLSALDPEARTARLQELVDAEAQAPFDLANGPMLRARLARLADDHSILLVNMHHIVSDGWSFGVFFRELEELYLARLARRPPALPELTLQYADYSEWQIQHLSGSRLEGLLAYWRNTLVGAPELLALPLDRPRPSVQAHRGATMSFAIPKSDGAALKQLLGRSRKTAFMGLLTVFAIVLQRCAQQDDIVIGTPVANRTLFEVENLIGFFVNTLPMRLRVSSSKSFVELLEDVSEVTLGAYEHQDLPFERMVEEICPTRSLSHSPLFQVMFAFQSDAKSPRPVTLPSSGGPEGAAAADIRMAKFDLSLYAAEAGFGFTCGFEYDVDLFDRATVDALAERFKSLLRQVIAAPDQPVGGLALEDRDRAVASMRELAGPAMSQMPAGGLARLIELQAGRTPGRTAIAWGDRRVSYAELNRQANQLANVLRAEGVGHETPVAVMMSRSPLLIVVLLAILKANGAYVPLNVRDPLDRAAHAVRSSGCRIVVCDEAEHAAALGALAMVLDPADLNRRAQTAPDIPPVGAAGPGDLAYIIFTSGSTGRPKGVAISQRGVLALMDWAGRHFAEDELSGVLASTAITFDISVFEIFAPLCHGGTVVLVDSILDLLGAPPAHPVSLVNTVPSAAAELIAAGGVPCGVRTICLAGEALSLRLAKGVASTIGGRLLNLYGPTEDTVYSTAWTYRPDTTRPPPIGRPLPGGRAYVLDRDLDPVPEGHAGELFLAGEGLARGYVGQPRLTATAFLPDPFSEDPGARMYRTGDRVRLGRDGDIEFLGRVDHQVKLRGFRIEPCEIEAALEEHPLVEAAVVQLATRGESEPQLIAWVSTPGADRLKPQELRDHLRRRIPEYMIPADVVMMAQLPRTPNGKVDRAALPAPEASSATSDPAAQPPRNALERTIAEAWRQVLGHGDFGVHQDFFELGGHSLLAAQVASRLKRVLSDAPPLRTYFEFRTVAGLAQAIASSPARPIDQPVLVPVQGCSDASEAGRDTATTPAARIGAEPSADAGRQDDLPLFKPRTAAEARALLSRIDMFPQEDIDRMLLAFGAKPESWT